MSSSLLRLQANQFYYIGTQVLMFLPIEPLRIAVSTRGQNMEVQTIQARVQVRFVGNTGRCEDCAEETRLEDALKRDVEEDRVSLSQAPLSLASGVSKTGEVESGEEKGEEEQDGPASAVGPKINLELSEEERRILNELRARDAEVRAHLAAAGPYANGAPTFEFQTGPDGRQYAVGGEVSIDASPVP